MKPKNNQEKKYYIQAKNRHNFFILLRQNLSSKEALSYARKMLKSIDVPIMIVDSDTNKIFLTINPIPNAKAMG